MYQSILGNRFGRQSPTGRTDRDTVFNEYQLAGDVDGCPDARTARNAFSLNLAPPFCACVALLRFSVLTNSAANLLECMGGRQAFERGADLLGHGVESFYFTRPVDERRNAERSVDE